MVPFFENGKLCNFGHRGICLDTGGLVAGEEAQLRQIDKENRWACKDGIWILRTTRQWLPRDLEVLKPLFERMRTEGTGFLQKNVALTEEVRRTFADIDRIEKELGRASKAIQSASGLVIKYRGRLQELCDIAAGMKKPPTPQRGTAAFSRMSAMEPTLTKRSQ
jgi:hypothetical protein